MVDRCEAEAMVDRREKGRSDCNSGVLLCETKDLEAILGPFV
jgi:hypothetical protein